jgi:hypothetical protein
MRQLLRFVAFFVRFLFFPSGAFCGTMTGIRIGTCLKNQARKGIVGEGLRMWHLIGFLIIQIYVF